MPYGPTHSHCEWLVSYAYADEVSRPSSFEALLYNDAEDQLGFRDDLGDITTEPSDGNYSRATLSFPADIGVVIHDRWVAAQPINVTFDFQGVTGRVDSIGIAWEAQLNDDSSPQKHLMVRQELEEPVYLEGIENTYPVETAWQQMALD